MRAFSLITVAVLAIAADPSAPKIQDDSKEIWETVFARDAMGRDQQVGYSRVWLEPVTVDGKKLLRGTRELRISLKRDGQIAELKAEMGTDEDVSGKVIGIFMKQGLGKEQMLEMNGQVDATGKSIDVKVKSNVKTNEFKNPWDPKALSIWGEIAIFRDKKVQPDDSFSYRFFAAQLSSIVTMQVKVKSIEEVLLPRGGNKKLLRVESKPDEIQGHQLPGSVIWLDPKTLEPILSQTELPGIGLLTMLRSTKAAATGVLGDVPDLMKMQTIRLPNRIAADVHSLDGMVFRVTLGNKDSDAAKLMKEDERQSIKELKGNTFELHIKARRAPRILEKPEPAADEYLESNYFINSTDENVKKLALRAVGDLTDPWEKAKAIERWVKENMKSVNYTEAMATSDHVAKTLSGDCSEFSMLAAAMCRAQNIPSRTAIGLVYIDRGQAPMLAFHMWTEVYIKGQWLGLDATIGQGSIGPGHIKITDHSWHKVLDLKPLLPVMAFLTAKPSFEIKEGHRSREPSK